MKKKTIFGLMIGLIVLGIVVILFSMSIAIVPYGHVGVYELFGNVDDNELHPGLHFKNPLANVHMMSVQQQEYTMSFILGEGAVPAADVTQALTKEGLPIGLDMTIRYLLKPTEAATILKTVGMDYVNIIVRPDIRSVVRDVVAKYDAKQIYSDERANITNEIRIRMEEHLIENGIILDAYLLRNVQLPSTLTDAIALKLTAQENIWKKEFEVKEAVAEADRKRAEAQGIKDSQAIIDESLTPEYLKWYFISNIPEFNAVSFIPIGPDGLPLMYDISGQE